MKYLVMECHEDYAVLLDEEAGFVKAKNTGLTVGDTIENPVLLKNTASHRSIIMKVTYGLAAAAACLAVVFGINHYNEYMTPYSNIRLSINPDVEMTLNHHGQVLSVEALNEDGEMLVEGYKPNRQDKLVVADELLERAIDMGFLSDNAVITFDIDTPDKELLTQYGIELRSEAEIYARGFDNVDIIIIDHNQESSEEHEYNEDDYEPIVIPVPQPTEETSTSETNQAATEHIITDSVYEETDDGDSNYDADDGDSRYGESSTEAATANPPATQAPAVNGDSGYDSNYGNASNYGDSLYDN